MNVKKLLFALLFALCALTLCGCGMAGGTECGADEFRIEVTNDCDGEIFAVYHEYSAGEEKLGGGSVQHADGTKIGKGEVLTFSYTAQEFPEGTDLSRVEIWFSVSDGEGNVSPAGKPVLVRGEFGKVYHVALSGSGESISVARIK